MFDSNSRARHFTLGALVVRGCGHAVRVRALAADAAGGLRVPSRPGQTGAAAASTCASAAARAEIAMLEGSQPHQGSARRSTHSRSLSPQGGFASHGWRGARQHEPRRVPSGHDAGDAATFVRCSRPISRSSSTTDGEDERAAATARRAWEYDRHSGQDGPPPPDNQGGNPPPPPPAFAIAERALLRRRWHGRPRIPWMTGPSFHLAPVELAPAAPA